MPTDAGRRTGWAPGGGHLSGRLARRGPSPREAGPPAGGRRPAAGAPTPPPTHRHRVPGHAPLPARGCHNAPVVLAFRFATASPAEVEAIVALVESAYRGPASRAGWTTEADLLDGQRTDGHAVRTIIADRTAGCCWPRRTRDLVGCCQLERAPGGVAYFGMFSVRPGAAGPRVGPGHHGGGRADRPGRLGRHPHVDDGDPPARTTSSPGTSGSVTERTGETEPFPYGDERFGIPKRPDLEFVVLEQATRLAGSGLAGLGRPGRDEDGRDPRVPAVVPLSGSDRGPASLASSAWTMASWASSSSRAALGLHLPFMSGTVRRKKITPPKQIQYQVFHWLPVVLAACTTEAPCFSRTWKFGSLARPQGRQLAGEWDQAGDGRLVAGDAGEHGRPDGRGCGRRAGCRVGGQPGEDGRMAWIAASSGASRWPGDRRMAGTATSLGYLALAAATGLP